MWKKKMFFHAGINKIILPRKLCQTNKVHIFYLIQTCIYAQCYIQYYIIIITYILCAIVDV